MAEDLMGYPELMERALKNVVRAALDRIADDGLPGEHHFYITFATNAPGVVISPRLKAQYADEMTIVLQHQFWGLETGDDGFEVTLSFTDVSERLVIPWDALVGFLDPSVEFGLRFGTDLEAALEGEAGADDAGADDTGDDETGEDDTGDDETGDDEPGDDETGDDETGDDETGDDETDDDETGDDETGEEEDSEDEAGKSGEVVTLDSFRKK